MCVCVCVYICIPHLYPFIWQWTFRLFPCLGHCKWCCYEYWGASVFSNYSFVWVGICPGVGLLDHMASLFFLGGGAPPHFSTVAVPIYIPTSSIKGFPFCHILSSISIFSPVYWLSLCLLWRNVCLGLLHSFQFSCLGFFVIELCELFICFRN